MAPIGAAQTIDRWRRVRNWLAMSKSRTRAATLSDDEVAYFCSAIGIAPLVLKSAREAVTRQYDLGPRGPWILGLIKVGVNSPSRLSAGLMIGRSLLTSELNRLVKAGLVVSQKDDDDGRRLTLSLTPEGEVIIIQLRQDLTRFVNERLAHYDHAEIMLCARILREFGGTEDQYVGLEED